MKRIAVSWRRGFLPCLASASLACIGLFPLAAAAQTYPSKPLRLIIPYAPGGGNDIFGRMAAQKLGEALGQNVITENRAGDGGVLGSAIVAKAPPDGYTMLLGHIGTLALNVTLRPELPYDPVKGFQPVTLLAKVPNILVVHPSLPVQSLKDLIALAKRSPGALTYGSGGVGSTGHLSAEYFKQVANVDMLHVPYKGTGPALVELMGGQIATVFAGAAGISPLVQSGKLRAIGVSSRKRLSIFPEVPTIAEGGLRDFEVTTWFGLVMPAGVPLPIAIRLSEILQKALHAKDMQKSFVALGAEPATSTPEEFGAFIRAEISRWAVVLKAANLKTD